MPNEHENEEKEKQGPTDPNADALQALAELKANSVSKDEYEKLNNNYKDLLNMYINGDDSNKLDGKDLPQSKTIDELKAHLREEGISNLDYCQTALDLRKAVIEAGGVDPFLPQGVKISADQNDIDAANRVAEVIQQCIDESDGDSNVFTAKLQSRTIDTGPIKPKK